MSAPLHIRERVEGTRRIFETDGWEWVIAPEFGDDDPRIADTHLAPRLGLAVKDLRVLARRHAEAGNITPIANTRTVRRFTSAGKDRGSVNVTEYLFTEADALFLVTRSEASGAIELTKSMIQVVLAVRRHLATSVPVEAHTRKLPKAKAPALEVKASGKTIELTIDAHLEYGLRRWLHAQGFECEPPAGLASAADAWLHIMSTMMTAFLPANADSRRAPAR